MAQQKRAEQAAVNQLKAHGSNADEPHPVEFFLYFPTEWDAYVAGTQLMNLQFQVTVRWSESEEKWLCLATKKLKPTSERLSEVSHFMEDLAVGNSGEYDGWGTAMTND